jgi:colanic acid/amylovoran biosynthesis glycosyltransferase
MKILFCTNTFENVINGPAKFANYLLEINRLETDTEIRILTEDITIHSTHRDRTFIFRLNLKLNWFTRPWGFVYRMFPYYQACLDIQRSYPYDVIVFNNAITGIWSAINLKTTVLGMINDDTSISTSLDNFQKNRKWLRHFLFGILEKTACYLMEGIIINSQYLHDLVSKQYNPRSRLHLLYKGTSIPVLPDFSHIDYKSPVQVLFVKADFTRGGLSDLITALDLLPEYNFELLIAGPDFHFKKEILSQNKSYHVNIKFLGPVSQSRVQNLMQACHLFIVPSHQEALGVANLEALAYGIPVISTRTGGIPEVLNQGANGWMVNPGKPDELARMIQYVIKNPKERLAKQKKGYDFIRQHFSQRAAINCFLSIVNSYRL